MTQQKKKSGIESELEIYSFLSKVKYCIESGDCQISLKPERRSEQKKDIKFTNIYTLGELFPNENPVDVLKRELIKLTKRDYIETLVDIDYPERSELRVFGKKYDADVYIKFRAELISKQVYGGNMIFVLSFHYAQYPFDRDTFPYA